MTNTIHRRLLYYQREMVAARSSGDKMAYELYRNITRQLTEKLREKEKSA